MKQNVGQFGFHEQIWIRISIALSVNSSPRRTYDEGISCKRFDLKKIQIDKFEFIEALLVDFHVVLQHLEFVGVQIVDNVLLKIVTEMDGDSSHPREGLKYLLDTHPNETLSQVVGNCLRDNRIPTLLVDGDALFEAGEEEIAFVEVAEEGFGDAVLLLEGGGAVVIEMEVKVTGMDLQIGGVVVDMVFFPYYLHSGQVLNEHGIDFHGELSSKLIYGCLNISREF